MEMHLNCFAKPVHASVKPRPSWRQNDGPQPLPASRTCDYVQPPKKSTKSSLLLGRYNNIVSSTQPYTKPIGVSPPIWSPSPLLLLNFLLLGQLGLSVLSQLAKWRIVERQQITADYASIDSLLLRIFRYCHFQPTIGYSYSLPPSLLPAALPPSWSRSLVEFGSQLGLQLTMPGQDPTGTTGVSLRQI